MLYPQGTVLELQVTKSFSLPVPPNRIVDVTVQEALGSTMSCVMSVRFGSPNGPLVVLKLYDRRGSQSLRRREHVGAWSPNVEEQYIKFVESGGAAEFLQDMWNEGKRAVNIPQKETWVHDFCDDFYNAEIDAYSRLEPLQGKNVPRLLATVSYQLQRTKNPEYQHFLSAHGIIMEFIDGFPLCQLPSYVSPEHWQAVCDSAISVIDEIGARGVLNEDVRPENIKVRKAQDGTYQLVCYDFGLSSTRDDFDTEEEWRLAKRSQDERGAVGVVMQGDLNKCRPGYYKYARDIVFYWDK